MMAAFPNSQQKQLAQFKRDYSRLCDIPGILRNDDKDAEGTTIKFLGRMVDSTTFTVWIPKDKVNRVISLTADALASDSMTIHEAQQLAGLLSFCASAVRPHVLQDISSRHQIYFVKFKSFFHTKYGRALILSTARFLSCVDSVL